MKNLFITLLMVTLVMMTGTTNAQIKIDLKKKIQREANKRANQKADKAVKKTFDAAEEGVSSAVTSEEKTGTAEGETAEVTENEQTSGEDTAKSKTKVKATEKQNEPSEVPQDEPKPELTWSKYDFVPGTEIIFEDNQEGEQNGEFPSKWDLKNGVIENATFDGSNVIYFRETGNAPNGIVPLITENNADYLPEEFTIEFDAYFEANKFSQSYSVFFYDAKNQKNNKMKRTRIGINEAEYGENQKMYPGAARSNIDKKAKWRHIAISFNKRALKIYMDDTRLINIPNITENPTGITLSAYNHREGQYFIKNIRIAKGAVPLYDKVLTDGKFITTGIKFDVNKATIKAESMGTINYVVKMMNDNPTLNFTVEGHTDSDGDDARNQSLSESRAKAISDKLQELGIASSRLKTKGWGESKPMAGNDTPEGKAQNRRVEFVKF